MCDVWAVRCDLPLDQWCLVDEKEERNNKVYDALTRNNTSTEKGRHFTDREMKGEWKRGGGEIIPLI